MLSILGEYFIIKKERWDVEKLGKEWIVNSYILVSVMELTLSRKEICSVFLPYYFTYVTYYYCLSWLKKQPEDF